MTHKLLELTFSAYLNPSRHRERRYNALLVGEFLSLTYLPNELAQKCANLIVMLLTIRNGFEIMAEMLSLCKEPKTKTQVMYGANLSWRMLQKYLSKLQSKGLMEVHHSPIRYVTTRKGLRFVKKWRELVELV